MKPERKPERIPPRNDRRITELTELISKWESEDEKLTGHEHRNSPYFFGYEFETKRCTAGKPLTGGYGVWYLKSDGEVRVEVGDPYHRHECPFEPAAWNQLLELIKKKDPKHNACFELILDNFMGHCFPKPKYKKRFVSAVKDGTLYQL